MARNAGEGAVGGCGRLGNARKGWVWASSRLVGCARDGGAVLCHFLVLGSIEASFVRASFTFILCSTPGFVALTKPCGFLRNRIGLNRFGSLPSKYECIIVSLLLFFTNRRRGRSMTKADRSTFVVAISLVLLLSLPQVTSAQTTVAYGGWYGYATDSVTYYDEFGYVVGTSLTSGPATLYVTFVEQYGYLQATVSGPPGFTIGDYQQFPTYGASLGPYSASGGAFAGGFMGYSGGFDVTYQGIFPDGLIDSTGGFAVADFSDTSGFPGENMPVSFATFNSAGVPEPSAIVPMAIGAVAVATSVVIRRRRAGKALARARAAGAEQAQSPDQGVPASRRLG